MTNLKAFHSKTKAMLQAFGRKNITFHFMPLAKKAGTKERIKLRQILMVQLKNHKSLQHNNLDWNDDLILNIKTKPTCPFASISISHCKNLGGFLFVFNKNLAIGFDMEEQNRIIAPIGNRVSSKEEIEQAPNLALLWSAKEASFKCLSNQKNSLLLRDCKVSNWKKCPTKNMYLFECVLTKGGHKAYGIASTVKTLVLAYAETKL